MESKINLNRSLEYTFDWYLKNALYFQNFQKKIL